MIGEKKSRNVQQSEFSPGSGKSLNIHHRSWNPNSKDPHKILTSQAGTSQHLQVCMLLFFFHAKQLNG
jgi:hypothetical protein